MSSFSLSIDLAKMGVGQLELAAVIREGRIRTYDMGGDATTFALRAAESDALGWEAGPASY